MESSEEIEHRAAAWLLRREGDDWSEEQQTQLAQWLDAATPNRVAYLRLEAGWEEANRLKVLDAGFLRGQVPSIEELNRAMAPAPGVPELPQNEVCNAELSAAVAVVLPARAADHREPLDVGSRKSRAKRFALAAGLLLVTGAMILAYTVGPLAGDRYTTPIGGVASVPLKDGSKVTLNTASAIRVAVTETERYIEIERGEAFFEVAKDPTRPFIVRAGHQRVVAVGTAFSVRRDGEDVRVVVTEGAVRMEVPGSGFSGTSTVMPRPRLAEQLTGPSAPAETVLRAGDVARAIDTRIAVESKPVPEVEESLSWRSGYVVFQETALAEAVAEFNRYNERKILIQDPAVAAIRLTGKFRSTNYESFVRLLEETFHIEARHSADRIILTAHQ